MKDNDKILGIAKRDINNDEMFVLPISILTGEILINDSINFIEGTTWRDLE